MLTPALRVGEPDPQAHGPHLCEHRPLSRKPAVPRRLNAPTPTLATVAEATPATNGVSFVHGYSGPQGVNAMVVAHFFESGQRRRLRWGRVESGTANGRRSSAGQHRVHTAAIDEKAWAGPRRLRARASQGSPQREPALPTETAREQSTRGARSSHPFESGAGSQPSCGPPGTGCSPANGTPLRSLDDCSSLRVINSFTAPVLL